MKSILFGLLLLGTVMAAYNVTRAKNMAFACAATFGT